MMRYASSAREAASRLSAVVLAGGKSSRFGQEKAEMELSGQRVLTGLIRTLRSFPFQSVAVVRSGGKAGDLPDQVEILEDDQEGLGPLGGILTALKHLVGGVLVTACDMPLVSGALIEWLLGRYDAGAEAVIPRHAGRMEPFPGIYARGMIPMMDEAARSGRFALYQLLEEVRVRFVEVPERFSVELEFANVNTPEDFRRISALAAGPR